MSRRRQTNFNRFWMILAAVIAVPLLLGLLLIIVINPNDYKPKIEDAVKSATGRDLKLNGDIQIGFGFSPTITIHQVELSNPPGFSRNAMASIGAISADISLPSLIFGKLNIGTLAISDADVQIEVNPLGKSNTDFSKPGEAAPAPTPATSAAKPDKAAEAGNPADKLSIKEVGIYGVRFAARDDQKGTAHELKINRAVLHMDSKSDPLAGIVDIEYDATPVAFSLSTGPIERLLGTGSTAQTWPVKVEGTSVGTTFSLVGGIREPLAGKGYVVDVSLGVDDLSALGKLAGGKLPPVHNLRTSFHLTDAGGVPDFSAVMLRAETSDLSSYVDGLTLDRLVLSAPATDKPIHADLAGRFSGQPLDAVLDIGAPRALIHALAATGSDVAATEQTLPFSVSSHVAGAELALKGQVAHPTTLSGLSASVELHVPDLTAISPLVGDNLPAVKNLSFVTDITDTSANGQRGVALRQIGLDSSVGDLRGDLELVLSPRPALRGKLASKLADLDGLQTASARAATTGKPGKPADSRPRAMQNARGRVIPDTPLDFSALNAADADLSLTVGELRSGGSVYRDLDAHVGLANGKLSIDPFSAIVPGGHFALKLLVDSQALPPEVSLSLNAPGLALKPLMQLAGQPDDVTGSVEIGADLVASGRTAHALAASLTGKLGVALVNAELDNKMFGSSVSDIVRVAHLPADALIGGSGANRTKLNCLALRIDSVRGLAQLSALAVQTATAQVQGSGSINLAEEVLGLRLRPALRTPGISVVVPVRLGGSFAAPQASIDAGVSAEGVAKSVTGGATGLLHNPLGTLGSAANSAVSGEDVCGPAISAARGAMAAK